MNRLKERYTKEIAPKLATELKLSNVMEVPRLMKISINAGIGPFRDNRDAVEAFVEEFTNIVGQKPYPRPARLSEAGFKIKKGDIVGYAVTLRGERMWAFIDKLINIVLPRVRDFRGLSDTSFDELGNYSLGIREHVIFPEVNANSTKGMRSFQITFVMNTNDIENNRALLKEIGVPFKKDEN